MKTAFRELIRRPSRFLTAGGALTLIVVLILLLGGLLDGLYLGSTEAFSAQSGGVFVYSKDANESLFRSRIDARTSADIARVEGVEHVSGLSVIQLGAQVPGSPDTVNVAFFGYGAANDRVPDPPAPGEGYADRSLEADGVRVGQQLEVGPQRSPVTVVGWVSKTQYSLQGSLWVAPTTWAQVVGANLPSAVLAPGAFQALIVTPREGIAPAALAQQIEAQVPGVSALTKQDAILSLPGVADQQAIFSAIIGVTFAVAGLVVALFFALLTLERQGLFGVLKAIGTSSRSLAAGLTLQAVLIAIGAMVAGGLLTLLLARVVPDAVPLQVVPRRAVTTFIGLIVTALIGSAISFRRITRIDPATAVGGA